MPRALHKKPRHQQPRVKDKKSGRVETTDGPKDKRVRAKNRNGDQDAQLSCAAAHQRGCLDPVTAMCRARCPDSKCGIHGAGCPDSKCGIHGAGCPDSNCYEQRAGCLDKKEQPHNSPDEEAREKKISPDTQTSNATGKKLDA